MENLTISDKNLKLQIGVMQQTTMGEMIKVYRDYKNSKITCFDAEEMTKNIYDLLKHSLSEIGEQPHISVKKQYELCLKEYGSIRESNRGGARIY